MTTTVDKTTLETIEEQRMAHVTAAMAAVLKEAGVAGVDTDVLAKAAYAAVCAADRYPADRTLYPFNCDIRQAPRGMHPRVAEAFQEIDAGIYSGDTFQATQDHLYLAAYVQRWSQELRRQREDDWPNRPYDDEDSDEDSDQG